MTGPLDIYRGFVTDGTLLPDPEQERAASALDRLYRDLLNPKKSFFGFGKPQPVKGIYIYGGVGRGKSMLMDLFFAQVPATIKKRRVHFQACMIETQAWLHQARSGKNPDSILPDYAKHVSDTVRVLCFDEFHVTDVADAMILSRLFTLLLDHGVAVVATSNWPPDRLYEGGLQRERFLPFIALIKERMEIIHLDSPTDYREEAVQDLETYLYPLNAETRAKADHFFHNLSRGNIEETVTITVKGRDIKIRAAGNAARFTFAQLCEQPHGAEDYLKIAERFQVIFIENIPRMNYDRNNECKRLMTLIDVLYDTRRIALFTAEAAPEKIYNGDKYDYEFERTISRLREMQSSSYRKAA